MHKQLLTTISSAWVSDSKSRFSGGLKRFSRFPWKFPFEIDFNLGGLNTVILRAVRLRFSNRAVGSKCTRYRSFIGNNCNV